MDLTTESTTVKIRMMFICLLICAITLTEVANTTELVDRAVHIANHEFHHFTSTSVIWWKSDPILVTNFLENYFGSVKLIKIRKRSRWIKFNGNFKQTVFFAEDPEEFDYFLRNLNNTIIYPVRVLLVITLPIRNISSLQSYTKISLDNDVSDIVIISTGFDDGKTTLTTYRPFLPGRCNNYDPITIESDAKHLFPQKFNNFYKCPITVIAAFSFPYVEADYNDNNIRGIDTEFLNIVVDNVNASMSILISNNSGAHIFEHVVVGDYDICLPCLVLNPERFNNAQASLVVKTLDIVICAPNQRELYAWAKVLLPFFTNITPFIILSFVLFLGTVLLIRRYGKLKRNVPKSIIFGTLGLFLGQEIKFETKYWLNNAAFMLWIWYCTIVRIAYQSDLVEGLQKTFLEAHLKSVQEALNVVDEFGGPEGLMLLAPEDVSGSSKTTIIPWKDIPQYIEEISKGRRFLLLTDTSLVNHSPYKVQVIDERLSSMPAAFLMRPRWGAAVALNQRMMQLFEAGFMTKISRNYQSRRWKPTSGASVDPLTLNTVASCFFGLVIINFLCCIVLFIEIMVYKLRHKNK